MAKKKYQKRNSTARQVRTAVIVVAVIVAVWWFIGHAKKLGFKRVESGTPASNVDVEALMEVNVPEGLRQQIVAYEGYTASFNADLRIPNYVVYELTRFETQGAEQRHDKFMCDTDVEGCPTTDDYKG